MLVVSYCGCNYCGHRFDELDEDELSTHLLTVHPDEKSLTIQIKFEPSELEKLIRGIT